MFIVINVGMWLFFFLYCPKQNIQHLLFLSPLLLLFYVCTCHLPLDVYWDVEEGVMCVCVYIQNEDKPMAEARLQHRASRSRNEEAWEGQKEEVCVEPCLMQLLRFRK